jgi:hypothetical protein
MSMAMAGLRIVFAIVFSTGLPLTAVAEDAFLRGGTYEVTYRLEVPHVELFAMKFSTRICVLPAREGLPVALPVLSQNNPLAKCPASAVRGAGDTLSFEIHCPGRMNEAARAVAHYKLKPGRFEGRIHMVMGGKNMTFVEVQTGHRVGTCGLASAP